MKRLILVLLCLLSFPLAASHIVGGEFEMVFKRIAFNGNHMYNISLILYFDKINGAPGARDPFVHVRIFRKRDNQIMVNDLLLNFYSTNEVEYFQPECSSGSAISTDRIFYTATQGGAQTEVGLDPDDFDDPEGYYISWERCCRNYGIKNAYSQDPNTLGGVYAGQTFYLEFPPLIRNGVPFINSSPRLFPPLSDYACPGRLYYVDFGGTDPDGDSLVYSMITPLNTKSGDALPPPTFPGAEQLPRPGPYPPITWRTDPPYNFGPDNIMNGNPDLTISKDGLLTVVPTLVGLYVFAVKCEEFRDGEKIGEIRRDFQMLVLAGCPVAQKPVIEAKPIGSPDSEYKQNKLSLAFNNVVDDDSRCVVVRITDPDSQSADDGNQENIKVRVIPLGFKDPHVNDILPDITQATLVNGSAAEFNICFPKCPYLLGPYKIGIISQDNACPLPLMDTIVVTVDVQLPPNNLPFFTPGAVTQTVQEGSGFVTWNIAGNDGDPDSLAIKDVSESFKIEDYGFEYALTKNEKGHVEAKLTWDTRCDVIDFSDRTFFPIRLTLNDFDECDLLPPDTLKMDLTMDLYNFHDPLIEYQPEPAVEEITLTRKVYETVNFNVLGSDLDLDKLILVGNGDGFNLQDYGITFPGATGNGNITSPFTWNINCNNLDLDLKNEFNFEFIVVDSSNRCHYYLADTLKVNVMVEPPDNTSPIVSVNGVVNATELSYTLGEPIVLNVVGTDANTSPTDLLKLELIEAKGDVVPAGYTFDPKEGRGTVQSVFAWSPGCEIYESVDYENKYTFAFKVTDDRCFSAADDTVEVDITIKDVDGTGVEFNPPNVITPNGDGCNDFFALEGLDEMQQGNSPCSDFVAPHLPADNCAGRFVSIRVYNRWGREVFASTERKFRWYAKDDAVGVYFYYINFSNKEYKGAISVTY